MLGFLLVLICYMVEEIGAKDQSMINSVQYINICEYTLSFKITVL